MNTLNIVAGFALLASWPVSACAQSDLVPDHISDQATALLEEVREIDRIPGVMAAVVRDGELIWSDAVGFADLESRTALTGRTRMRIGSVSKPLTAAMVLRLSSKGHIDLDAA